MSASAFFYEKRDVLCVTFALAAHSFLLMWKGHPERLDLGDPIVGVDFVVEEVKPEPPPPPEEKEEKSFFNKIKHSLGIATTPEKIIEPPKPTLSMGEEPPAAKIDVKRPVMAMTPANQLVNKNRELSGGFSNANNLATRADIQNAGPVGGGGIIKDKAPVAGFRVARGDLPFDVKQGKPGDMMGGTDPDAPQIVVSKKSDRGVRNLSASFDGGGTAGAEPGLKDRGGGLSGVSGGFSNLASAPARAGAGSAAPVLAGAGSGASRNGGRAPYEISGPLSGRKILENPLPVYPESLQSKGIIATVGLHLVVLHTGEVKVNIVVVKTSGYPAMDRAAVDALRRWLFEPLPENQYGQEQEGTITFKFRAV